MEASYSASAISTDVTGLVSAAKAAAMDSLLFDTPIAGPARRHACLAALGLGRRAGSGSASVRGRTQRLGGSLGSALRPLRGPTGVEEQHLKAAFWLHLASWDKRQSNCSSAWAASGEAILRPM